MATTKAVAKSSAVKGLGSLGSLFSESWELFKKSWTQQLVLMLLTSLISFFIFLFAIIAFALINVPQLPAVMEAIQNNGEGLQAVLPTIWTSGGIILFVMLVALWFVGIAYSVGTLLLIQGIYKGQKMSYGEALKAGLSKAGPVFVLSMIGAFLVLGGYWLLLIPGMIISIYLAYSLIELSLHNESPLNAVRQSVKIVGANFWGILGRIAVLIALFNGAIIVSAVFGESLQDSGVSGLWSIANMVLQYGLQFFAVAYALVLYNRARSASANAKQASLKLMVVVAVIGWVFAFVVGGAIVSGLKTAWPMIQEAYQSELEQSSDSMMYEDVMQNGFELDTENSAESESEVNMYLNGSPLPYNLE